MRTTRAFVLVGVLAAIAQTTLAQDNRPPAPEELDFRDGVAKIPDRATFEKLSYQGNAGRDAYLDDIEFVKFQLEDAGTDEARLYFMNTKTRQAHPMFMRAIGIGGGFGRGRGRGPGRGGGGFGRGDDGPGRQMRGAIAYRPRVRAPDGTSGVYTYDFQPNDSFSVELLKFCQDLILEKAPFLKGKLVYHPLYGGLARYEREQAEYEKARITVYLDHDLDRNLGYLPLNPGETFGRLRLMKRDELPTPRDVVLYESLPNELPRVAGIITSVRQTPLSHVNLRAIQDSVPNSYVTGAATNETITPLIGKYVHYEVAEDGFEIREATRAEVESHFAGLRPPAEQTPRRDLSITTIKPLDEIGFGDAAAFGVKTTNLAAMRKFKLPAGTVPNGFGVPFHFYVAFMKHNKLYGVVEALLADPAFRDDRERQRAELAKLRERIQRGSMPESMRSELRSMQKSFPEGTRIRCRSSTNNEDLPGFSGAGLYDSYSHDPTSGHIAVTVQRVFASLWNFRAFEEREFYRVDHLTTAMGVLVHPSYTGELANGVAVTVDVLYQTDGYYYLNTQVGEDMITNPTEQAIPEEVLLGWWKSDRSKVMQFSNRVGDDERILSDAQLDVLRGCLGKIHGKFAKLYGVDFEDPGFAMEIEYKIMKGGKLAIKQARPWVFPDKNPARLSK